MFRIPLMGILLFLQGFSAMVWDGGFPDGEYVFKFTDKDKAQIEGVVVEIYDTNGLTRVKVL